MKNKSILSLVLLLAGMMVVSTSCSDMLTPDLERYSEKSAKDSIYSYLGILKSMQSIVERGVVLGEARGDLVNATTYTSDSVSHVFNFDEMQDGDNAFLEISDYYNVINGCNFYLHYVDTADVKDGVKYMEKEWSQVQAMRAWTYMQLVNNYGSVPFVTEPISSSEQGIELETNAPRATKDNLADLLVEAGLERAYEVKKEYGYPSYGTYNNGNVSINARSCYFPPALVLADLYLMQNSYDKAAEMYYNFITDEAYNIPTRQASYFENITEEGTYYIPNSGNWTSCFSSYSVGGNNDEIITLIPGAASKSQGTVLISLQNIFGFQTSSTSGTSSGNISVSPSKEYRQLQNSLYYDTLNVSQLYCDYSSSSGDEVQEFYEGIGDARYASTVPYYRNSDGEEYRYICKRVPVSGVNYNFVTHKSYARDFNSYYAIPVYRKSLVYLRFAEAINRAGFPEYAFSILKDGIATDNYPTLSYKDSINYVIQDSDTVSIDTIKDVPYLQAPEATTGGAYYVGLQEMLDAQSKSYLYFSDSKFNHTPTDITGIHGYGCGETRGYRDTLYTYNLCVAGKIASKLAEENSESEEWIAQFVDSINKVGVEQAVTDGTITKDQVIEAVEDLIIDELALETAFEGNRYYDLMRFANHKGNGTLDNEWLAKKIAARNVSSGYDETLYSRLVDGTHWYLPMPIE